MRAFTLLEMLVATAVFGLLVSMLFQVVNIFRICNTYSTIRIKNCPTLWNTWNDWKDILESG